MKSNFEKINAILDASDEEGLRSWAWSWLNELADGHEDLLDEEYQKIAPPERLTAQGLLDFLLRLEQDHVLSEIVVNFRTDYDSDIQAVVEVAEDIYDEVTNTGKAVTGIILVANKDE